MSTPYFPNDNRSGRIVSEHCPLWYLTDWTDFDPPTTEFDDPAAIRREAWELIEALSRALDGQVPLEETE